LSNPNTTPSPVAVPRRCPAASPYAIVLIAPRGAVARSSAATSATMLGEMTAGASPSAATIAQAALKRSVSARERSRTTPALTAM